MIIVAFSSYTSKILPRIMCRVFRHVAVITRPDDGGDKLVLHQFIRPGHIEHITLHARDIGRLGARGWHFVYLCGHATHGRANLKAMTCVAYAKDILGIRNLFIQTPYSLYRYLRR